MTYDGGRIQFVVDYFIFFGPLLYSDELIIVVWIIIMQRYAINGARQSSPLYCID
jgi:hypothetical protein